MADYWKISKELVERIALISKLELSDKEKEQYRGQLEDVLKAFKALDEVDTKDTEPAFHPRPVENSWREDKVSETPWEPLSEIKEKENGFYKGPRII